MSNIKKFSLRIKPTVDSSKRRLSNPNNKAEAIVSRSKIREKAAQLLKAVAWFNNWFNNCNSNKKSKEWYKKSIFKAKTWIWYRKIRIKCTAKYA